MYIYVYVYIKSILFSEMDSNVNSDRDYYIYYVYSSFYTCIYMYLWFNFCIFPYFH